MSAVIPHGFQDTFLSHWLLSRNINRIGQGKTRDIYELSAPDKLLIVGTDRVSIFDIILPAYVAYKGEVLTALTVYWLVRHFTHPKHHLVAWGPAIDGYLRAPLRGNTELYKRAVVVEKYQMLPVEAIVRGNITGSGWKDYCQTKKVCGILLQEGLRDGDLLSEPLFTPSTKAQAGHDENISFEELVGLIGQDIAEKVRTLSIQTFCTARTYARTRGIIIADTKFEWGYDATAKGCVLADEVLTPDSSRFWDEKDWQETRIQGGSPISFDKQFVRDHGKRIQTPFINEKGQKILGINNLNPSNPEHVAFVHSLTIPEDVLSKTTQIYLEIFKRLTQMTLQDFQKDCMHIN